MRKAGAYVICRQRNTAFEGNLPSPTQQRLRSRRIAQKQPHLALLWSQPPLRRNDCGWAARDLQTQRRDFANGERFTLPEMDRLALDVGSDYREQVCARGVSHECKIAPCFQIA